MPTKRRAPASTESSTPARRTSRDVWAELGAMLASACAAAEQDLASRFATAVETRFAYFTADKALRKAVARALQGPCDTDAIVRSFGYWDETRDLTILRSLTATWEHLTDREDFDADEAWRLLAAHLHEEVARNLDEGRQHVEGARGFDLELARQRDNPVSLWPLEPAGDLRERVRAWREAAAARGVSKRELLDPETLPSRMTFTWQGTSGPLRDLSAWLADRAAWSRALAIVLPLLGEAEALMNASDASE